MKSTIYCLIDPISYIPVYVGKTSLELEKRLNQHLIEKNNEEKKEWIDQLKTKNVIPIIKSLEEVDEALASEREKYWVEYYHDLGHRLFNNRLLKRLQTFDELEWFKKNRTYLSINKIEKAIGMPITTLDKALKGRGLPSNWHAPFKKWVADFINNPS
jgi:GIY-YIG catalytic domain-containing protein